MPYTIPRADTASSFFARTSGFGSPIFSGAFRLTGGCLPVPWSTKMPLRLPSLLSWGWLISKCWPHCHWVLGPLVGHLLPRTCDVFICLFGFLLCFYYILLETHIHTWFSTSLYTEHWYSISPQISPMCTILPDWRK